MLSRFTKPYTQDKIDHDWSIFKHFPTVHLGDFEGKYRFWTVCNEIDLSILELSIF